jgi:hypothetical protein
MKKSLEPRHGDAPLASDLYGRWELTRPRQPEQGVLVDTNPRRRLDHADQVGVSHPVVVGPRRSGQAAHFAAVDADSGMRIDLPRRIAGTSPDVTNR